jgi:hypothetical protein
MPTMKWAWIIDDAPGRTYDPDDPDSEPVGWIGASKDAPNWMLDTLERMKPETTGHIDGDDMLGGEIYRFVAYALHDPDPAEHLFDVEEVIRFSGRVLAEDDEVAEIAQEAVLHALSEVGVVGVRLPDHPYLDEMI